MGRVAVKVMIRRETATADDSGVSETLGSILVFGIVVSGIAIILLFGMNILNNSKDQNNFQSVSQGFKVIQSDIKRTALEQMPVKTTRIHMDGGTIALDPSKTISITYNGKDSAGTYLGSIYSNIPTGYINYAASGTTNSISLENGGLWSREYDYDYVKAAPRIFLDPDNMLVLNVIRLDCSAEKFAGTGTINLFIKATSNRVLTYTGDPGAQPVTIIIQTSYPAAWSTAFNAINVPAGSTIVTTPGTDQVQVTISGVKKLIISEHTVKIDPMSIST